MARAKKSKEEKTELLESEIQQIINDTSDGEVTLFNQHRVLLEKGQRNLLVCKQNDAKKLKNKTHEWVKLDSRTSVLRKV